MASYVDNTRFPGVEMEDDSVNISPDDFEEDDDDRASESLLDSINCNNRP